MQPQVQELIRDYEQAVSRIILVSVRDSPLHLGVGKTIGVLRGVRADFVDEHQLDEQATYGVLRPFSNEYLRTIIDRLRDQGLLGFHVAAVSGLRSALILTYKGERFLSHSVDVEVPFVQRPGDAGTVELTEDEADLLGELVRLRGRLAAARGVRDLDICPDSILRRMAHSQPTRRESLLRLPESSEEFVRDYADLFIQAIVVHVFADYQDPDEDVDYEEEEWCEEDEVAEWEEKLRRDEEREEEEEREREEREEEEEREDRHMNPEATDSDEGAPDGLGSDEIDWDSTDYE